MPLAINLNPVEPPQHRLNSLINGDVLNRHRRAPTAVTGLQQSTNQVVHAMVVELAGRTRQLGCRVRDDKAWQLDVVHCRL